MNTLPGNDPLVANIGSESDQAGLSDGEHSDDSKKGKIRRELPPHAVSTLKNWLLSDEHFTHPYPTTEDQDELIRQTGINKKQLKNWFTNARRRIWKPMIKQKLEDLREVASRGMLPQEAENAAAIINAAQTAGINRGSLDSLVHGLTGASTTPQSLAPHNAARGIIPPPSRPLSHQHDRSLSGQPRISAPPPSMRLPSSMPQSSSTTSLGMPRAPSVNQLSDKMKKTDSMALLEYFLQDSTSEQQQGPKEFPSTSSLNGMYMEGEEEHKPFSRSGSLLKMDRATLSETLPSATSLLELRSSGSLSSLAQAGQKRSLENLAAAAEQRPFKMIKDEGPRLPNRSNVAIPPQANPTFAPPPASMARPSSSELLRRVSSHELVNQGKVAATAAAEVMITAVRVHKTARCAFCSEGDVDTQLRPCGHLFHGRCLKPWLQAANSASRCLQCQTPISTCVLAIPYNFNTPGPHDLNYQSSWANERLSHTIQAHESMLMRPTTGQEDITQDALTIEGDDPPPRKAVL